MRPSSAHRPRGFTLLEAMISLTILAIGLLGLMQLQILGIWDNQGARAQTQATQLAKELANALERLPIDSTLLTAGTQGATPPSCFGAILGSSCVSDTTVKGFADATPVPGAKLDAALEPDPRDTSKPIFRRRWMVWDYFPTGVAANGVANSAASKIIAVSVIYHERHASAPDREVVLFTQRANPGLFLGDVSAYR
jgi:type IV pilus assembly protein PilV